jgi:tRNA 2-selenouridine synthase
MALIPLSAVDALSRLTEFDAVLDARSEAEFALDHLPGAANWYVLNNFERAEVGTAYKQVNPFEARKRGAALVAANIARHILQYAMDKPRSWTPLVYCWRGGQRSGSLAWFLSEVGFRTHVVQGGYKALRAALVADTAILVRPLRFQVLCGKTGSGKTRLLQALAAEGSQVLDLEALAAHRGSVLGLLPDRPQPSQKAFETAIWHALRSFDPARPVWVEAESAKIGAVRVPEPLMTAMRERGSCWRLELPDNERVALLLEDYALFVRDPALFKRQVATLTALRGKDAVARWQAHADAGEFATAFASLMREHYDPLYLRSTDRHYAGYRSARTLALDKRTPAAMAATAQALAASSG